MVLGHPAEHVRRPAFLHPPRQKLWSSDGQKPEQTPRYAFLGVPACDLAAIAMLNGVLGTGTHPDQGFVGRLGRIFVVAVNCTERGGLCFLRVHEYRTRGRAGLRPGAHRAH